MPLDITLENTKKYITPINIFILVIVLITIYYAYKYYKNNCSVEKQTNLSQLPVSLPSNIRYKEDVITLPKDTLHLLFTNINQTGTQQYIVSYDETKDYVKTFFRPFITSIGKIDFFVKVPIINFKILNPRNNFYIAIDPNVPVVVDSTVSTTASPTVLNNLKNDLYLKNLVVKLNFSFKNNKYYVQRLFGFPKRNNPAQIDLFCFTNEEEITNEINGIIRAFNDYFRTKMNINVDCKATISPVNVQDFLSNYNTIYFNMNEIYKYINFVSTKNYNERLYPGNNKILTTRSQIRIRYPEFYETCQYCPGCQQ